MDRLEATIIMLDYALNTRRKRHIVGGALMSVALLFGGLSCTILTIKMEGDSDEY